MALLQIAEPGQSPRPHERRRAAGIDLGTTNSLVATVHDGQSQVLTDSQGRAILPSAVYYRAGQAPEVGVAARQFATEDPLNTIVSVKRLMGRGLEDVKSLGSQLPYHFVAGQSQMPAIETAAGVKSPVEVSADILMALRQRAEAALGGELAGTVITVPAYFDDAQRQATKDAARLAGLKVLRLLNEPTAAAVAYGLDCQAEGVVAVYDLGGGTFDISVLRLSRGVFEVLATGGDSALGGDDFDHAIASWVLSQAGADTDPDAAAQRRLLQQACAAKEALTDQAQVALQYGSWRGELSRDDFDGLIEPLLARTLKACRRALRDAHIGVDEVDTVVMVGGSTRVPAVRRAVAELFGSEPLIDIDPDQVVALGAAIQADILAGNKREGDDMLLLDVTPLSLGIETMGGLMEKIIPRNSAIPLAKAQDFTTYKDGQTAIMIHVLQGERELVKDVRSLARFELHGIPPMPAGAAKVRVTFQVDADGLLAVSARELSSGVEASVQVKPSYGLGDDEVSRMLRESFDKAGEDFAERALREQQVEAGRLLEAVDSALAADGDQLLTAEERIAIEAQRDNLKALLAESDQGSLAALEQQIKGLSQITEAYAARRMDAAVKQALSGQRLDELDE